MIFVHAAYYEPFCRHILVANILAIEQEDGISSLIYTLRKYVHFSIFGLSMGLVTCEGQWHRYLKKCTDMCDR